MAATSPASPLITPDLRRRLQQRFEEAQRQSSRALPDFHQIHKVLAECLRADPGNTLYLDALLANLKRRDAAAPKRGWLSRLFGAGQPKSRSKPAVSPSEESTYSADGRKAEQRVLSEGPDTLWECSLHAPVLIKLAQAAALCGFEEAELRYLTAAQEAAPDDADTVRRLVRVLTRQGRFDEALEHWSALHARLPADDEAARAIDDIRSAAPRYLELGLKDTSRKKVSADVESLISRAHSAVASADFATAEDCLTRAQSAAGGDLGVLELREELRLLQSEHRVAIARRRVKSDPHPRAEAVLGRLADEHNRLEVDIWNLRVERLPASAEARLELARRLKRVGNFSGAIQRLAEAQKLSPGNPETLIVLGECWQHLRQFDKALQFYEQAVVRSKSIAPTDEISKLARYRAGVLSAAMGHRQPALGYFEAVIAADPVFKDARQRLDKLRAN